MSREIFIFGIGTVQVNAAEYTTQKAADLYKAYMQGLYGINIKTPAELSANPSLYDQLVNYVNGFKTIARDDPENLFAFTMAEPLSNILKSMKAAGIDVDNPNFNANIPVSEKIVRLQRWHDLGGFGIAEALQQAITIPNTRSIQAMIELDYVKTGNDVIFDSLTNLESALTNTKGILDTLATVQDISNQLTVANNNTAKFKFPPQTPSEVPPYIITIFGGTQQSHLNAITADLAAGDAQAKYNTFINRYKIYASAFFMQQFPTVTASTGYINQLLAAKNSLMSQLVALEALSPSNNRNVANTLAANIYKVALDISGAFAVPGRDQFTALKTWIMDAQNLLVSNPAYSTTTGQIQDKITQAIRAGESLNDTQKENVRRYMFLFEEFYKSANAVLSKINQLIEKMAQAIGR